MAGILISITPFYSGAYYFEECGIDNPYPTIGIEVGKAYVFVQEDISNWYHPLGKQK
jgi:hypothetical protein